MTDKQQAAAAPNPFTAAMDMIGEIGSRVAAHRKQLKDAGFADETADRMAEKMAQTLMEAVEMGIAKAKGGNG